MVMSVVPRLQSTQQSVPVDEGCPTRYPLIESEGRSVTTAAQAAENQARVPPLSLWGAAPAGKDGANTVNRIVYRTVELDSDAA
jgi:hypothetical protein